MVSAHSLDRRTLLRGAGALGAGLATGASTGCDSDDDDALTFFFQAAPDEARVRLHVIDAFRELRPDIKIRVEMAGPSPQQQILTYCAGGKCPDVLMSWESYSWLAELGVLLDLNTMLDRDRAFAANWTSDCSTPLREIFRFNGGQYVMPEQWAGIFLYYNKRLFDEAGLAPPPARWEDAWTYAEFLDAARAMTKQDRDGTVTQWGFVDAWAVPYYSASIFGVNNGVEWFTPTINPTHTNIDNDAFIEGFQFYTDLALKYRVAPRVADRQSVSGPDLFATGKAAMALVGHWMYSSFLAEPDLDFDVTVLPKGPRGHSAKSDVGATGLSIASGSRHKEQAWEFVKFATGPLGQALVASSGLFVPASKSALHSQGFADAHRRVRNLEVLTGGPDNSRMLPITPTWNRVADALQRGSDHVLRGAATADWFKDGLADKVNQLLQGGL